MESENFNVLKDGDDSGAVPEKVKRQLLSDGLGICAAPDCNNRIDVNKTRLGECAHIIPRKVGSHPREDYATPLEDRKKEANLLYLCEKHHKIVDNSIHADLYTAVLLRDWKKAHEDWGSNLQKGTPYISAEMKKGMNDLLRRFGQGVEETSNSTTKIIENLIDHARELLNRRLVSEAEVLLSQINLFLLDVDNDQLVCQAKVLNATLFSRQENIVEAKKLLSQLIEKYPSKIDPMLEYIDLCESYPEIDDRAKAIETAARDLDASHPRLFLLDTRRTYDRGEIVDPASLPEGIGDDHRLNMQLVSLKSLFYDMQNNCEMRDEAIKTWESTLPNSPRPHLYRVIFKVKDILSGSESNKSFEQALDYSLVEKNKVREKDPLDIRDELSWTLQELKLVLSASQRSDNEDRLGIYCEKYISLISKCYFNPFIDQSLSEFLSHIMIKPDHWRSIVDRIYHSRVKISPNAAELIFVQGLRFNSFVEEINKFLKFVNDDSLLNIFEAISNKNESKLAELLNERKNSVFSLSVMRFMTDSDLQVRLLDLIEVEERYKTDLIYSRFHILSNVGNEEEALKYVASLPIDDANIMAVNKVADIAFQNKKWNLFIGPANKLLEFDLEERRKTQLHAELAYAYSNFGDDNRAVEQARLALSNHKDMSEENAQIMLHIAGRALSLKGDIDGACSIHNEYRDVPRNLPLLFEEADLLIKSTISDKYDLAFSLIQKGFKEAESYEDGMFLAAFMLLVELGNAGKIVLENESVVAEGLFVKVSGFKNDWFYIGSDKDCIDAECISDDVPVYAELVGKKLLDEVEWPSAKFSGDQSQHKILQILTLPAYLSQRAHEAMENEAKIGKAPIWSIRVINDDGTLDLENLKNFHDEAFGRGKKFFNSYVASPLPFAFLCKSEGSISGALGKISSEKQGYVRCNNGTQEEFSYQYECASSVVNEKLSCTLDGMVAIVLAESGLADAIGNNVDLVVHPSVIRMIREIASGLTPSVGRSGRGSFVGGNFTFSEIDPEREGQLRNKLIETANFFDSRISSPTLLESPEHDSDERVDLEGMIPAYFLEPFRLAQQGGFSLLSDDALLMQAFQLTGEKNIPPRFSTISLMRVLVDKNIIVWNEYIKFFSLLSTYRYFFLSISADDMIRTLVNAEKSSGLITIEPKRLEVLNLRYVLSVDYGVDQINFIRVLAEFFFRIITDDTITKDISEEVFKYIIFETFDKRNAQLVARAIVQVCNKKMPSENWRSGISNEKLDLLILHLTQYIQHFSPIYMGR